MQRRIVQLGAKKEPRRKVGPIGVAPETGGCNQTFYSKCGKGEGNGAAAKPRRNFLSGLTACAPEQGASEKGEIVLPTREVKDRDDLNYEDASHWNQMSPPIAGATESVYLHDLAADENGETFAAYVNEELGLGLKVEFPKEKLPYFVQWKSLGAGDYAMGLEPSNSHILGRLYHEANGTLPVLKPFEKETVVLKVTVLDGADEIAEVKREAERLAYRPEK